MTDPREAERAAGDIEPGPAPAAEPTLAELMSRLGRRIPFAVSLAICGISVVTLTTVLLVSPARWRLVLALAAAGSFGSWILADHERRDRGDGRAWRLLQEISGLVGVVAVFVLLLSFLATALGLWIS